MATLEVAIELAAKYHAGQKDKGGHPYILHPLRLMMQAKQMDHKIIAVLHDIVEDTSITFDDLRLVGFSDRVICGIDALTKRQGEKYEQAMARVMENPDAIEVKILDMTDNSDLSRLPYVTPRDQIRVAKYSKWLTELRRKQNEVRSE